MGASSWDYFTPYRKDPKDALAELRQEVFESGDYLRPEILPEEFEPESIEDVLAASREEGTHSILDIQTIAAEPRRTEGASGSSQEVDDEILEVIKEHLLEKMFDSEMADKIRAKLSESSERLCTTPTGFGEVAVLGDDLLLEVFGTTTPDKETVLDGADRLEELVTMRWTGVCVPVYEDGEPNEYFFVGRSGD